MKTLTPKQEARLEKKKKKMAALAEIVKLNDKDRVSRKNYRTCSEGDSGNGKECENTVSNKSDSSTIEPQKKRIKIENNGDFHVTDDPVLHKCKNSSSNNQKITNAKAQEKSGGDIAEDQLELHEQQQQQAIKNNIQLTEEQYVLLKRELTERKRNLKHVPKIRLKEQGEAALLSNRADSRTPIFLTDIQHLLMSALLGSGSPCTPHRWCHLEKPNRLSHTIVLIVEGISLFHFSSYENNFVETNRIFDQKLEVIMPPHKEGKTIEELATVPLTSSQRDDLITQYGSLEAAIELKKDPTLMVKTVFPVESPEEPNPNSNLPHCDKFSRTQLLLSALQMVDEGYPLPLQGQLARRYQGYVLTKDTYTDVTSQSPMFGLDCEMCRTTIGMNELTRISIVNENMKIIYESLVRPTNKIIDYLTQYSGITPEMMINVTKTLRQVQNEVRDILPKDAILVGQSLNADLHAMKMMHPYVIDTSVIFNITGERKRKAKLRTLAKEFLGEIIQVSLDGHDPTEDSLASLKLAKLKLSKGLDFGDAVLGGRRKANETNYSTQRTHLTIGGTTKELSNNLFAHMSCNERRTAIVTSEDMNIDFQKIFNDKANIIGQDGFIRDENILDSQKLSTIDCFKTEGNKETIRKTREIGMNYSLTITSLNIAPQKLELSKIDKTLSNIDKWISKIWDTVSHNGLFIVVLGGTPGASSGVAMVKVKRNVADVVTDTPVTV